MKKYYIVGTIRRYRFGPVSFSDGFYSTEEDALSTLESIKKQQNVIEAKVVCKEE